MSESQFLDAYNSVGSIANDWVFVVLFVISSLGILFSVGISLHRDSVNDERHTLFVISFMSLVILCAIYSFYVFHVSGKVVDRYTKKLEYQHVTVDRISYGEYVRFSYTDRDGNNVDAKVDKSVVNYIRDLKKGEKVRVDFKEINIKTIKADEAPNGLYDVKVHVDRAFDEKRGG